MRYVLFITVLLFCSSPCYARVDIKFTPSKDCEETIISFIDNAKDSIDVAVYSINNDGIVSALKKAHDRGVKLRILTDKLQASNRYSRVIELHEYGIDIKVNSKHRIEHNKFAIFDSKSASTGSFNWTNSATRRNSENCLFLMQDNRNVDKYMKRFEHLWKINSPVKSEQWFERIKSRRPVKR